MFDISLLHPLPGSNCQEVMKSMGMLCNILWWVVNTININFVETPWTCQWLLLAVAQTCFLFLKNIEECSFSSCLLISCSCIIRSEKYTYNYLFGDHLSWIDSS
jgi:hypothetical protein